MPSLAVPLSDTAAEPQLHAPLPGSQTDTSAPALQQLRINDEIVIRQADPGEFGQVEDLLVTAFNTGCWVSQGYERNLRTVAERSLRFHIWVAASSESILGVVLTPRLEHYTGASFTFSVLAVHPVARGLHLGEHLVRHAISLARAHGFATLEIHSSPQMSQAHRVYYRVGFVRRLDAETRFVDEYEERLLTFTYAVPDPLPSHKVIIVPKSQTPLPEIGPWGQPPIDKSDWPNPPAGGVDFSGSYQVSGERHDIVSGHVELLGRALARHGIEARLADLQPSIAKLEEQIKQDLWDGIYAVLYSSEPMASDVALRVLIARLDYLDSLIAQDGPFLHGTLPRADDVLLTAWLLNFDFAFRAVLGFGAAATVNFPRLWDSSRRVLALLDASDLVPDSQSSSLWGELPPIPALAALGFSDLREAWLAPVPVAGSPARERPTGARLTPYVEDLPEASPKAKAAVGQLVATVLESELGEPESELEVLESELGEPKSELGELTLASNDLGLPDLGDTKLGERLSEDLYRTAARISNGSSAVAQLALRRVFQARLSWLDFRLGHQPWLGGESPSADDYLLLPLLRDFDAVAQVFPPIDPVLADYPNLLKYLSNSLTTTDKEK